ncbi:MAG: sporulation sigma factor SigG [Clostridiaceae bacterium]|nr:sporulation sigma factor SigG [Clostridiaceae bacterium]
MMISEVELCRINSSNLPVLKDEEMNELLFKLQHGDYECKETIIKANTKLILNAIQRFDNGGENTNDLFKLACSGVMKSAYKFNLSLSVRFSTYAAPIIINEIRRYLRASNPIRLSSSLRTIAYKALNVRDKLVAKSNKEPTISQIAKELDLSREDIVFALDTLQ